MDALTPPPAAKPSRPVGLYIAIGVGAFILIVIAVTAIMFVSSSKNDIVRAKELQAKLTADGVVYKKADLLSKLPPSPADWCDSIFQNYKTLDQFAKGSAPIFQDSNFLDLSQPKGVSTARKLLDHQRAQLLSIFNQLSGRPLVFPFDWRTSIFRTYGYALYSIRALKVLDGLIILDADTGKEAEALSLIKKQFPIATDIVNSPDFSNSIFALGLIECNCRALESVIAHAKSVDDLKACQALADSIKEPDPIAILGGSLAGQIAALDYLSNPHGGTLHTPNGTIHFAQTSSSLFIINSVRANVYQRALAATTLFRKDSNHYDALRADLKFAAKHDIFDLLAAVAPQDSGLREFIRVGGLPVKMWYQYSGEMCSEEVVKRSLDLMARAEIIKIQSGDYPAQLSPDNSDGIFLPENYKVHYDYNGGDPIIWSALGKEYGDAPAPDPEGFLSETTVRIDVSHPTSLVNKVYLIVP